MEYVKFLDVPRFSARDALAVGPKSYATLRSWNDTEAFLMRESDRRSLGTGRPHLFTLRRILQIALIAEMVKFGLSPRRAGIFAAGFTDVGDAEAGWEGEPDQLNRLPGQLYPTGDTLLIVYPDEDEAEIVNVHTSVSIANLFRSRTKQFPASAIIVDIGLVDARVRQTLGLSPDWGQVGRDGE